jgi:hypothetical protein
LVTGYSIEIPERLYIDGTQHEYATTHGVHGPTIAGKINIAPNFPIVERYGEDEQWWRMVLSERLRVYLGGARDFIWNRFLDKNHKHAYPFGRSSMMNVYSGRIYRVIEGLATDDRPTEMVGINQEIFSEDFDRMIQELTS